MMSIHKITDGLEAGTLVMTHDLMAEVLEHFSYMGGWSISIEALFAAEYRFSSFAQVSWIPILFDLLKNPPEHYVEYDPDDWDLGVRRILCDASASDPEASLKEAISHFPVTTERMRGAVITVLKCTENQAAVLWLNLIADDLDQCSMDTIIKLVDAYRYTGGDEAPRRVRQIRQRVPIGQSVELDEELDAAFAQFDYKKSLNPDPEIA